MDANVERKKNKGFAAGKLSPDDVLMSSKLHIAICRAETTVVGLASNSGHPFNRHSEHIIILSLPVDAGGTGNRR